MDKIKFLDEYYVDRIGTNSVKWDSLKNGNIDYHIENTENNKDEECYIPMWIADMDFKTQDSVINALKERIDHGAFGYTTPSASYIDTFNKYQLRQTGVEIKKDWLYFAPTVVTSLYWIVDALTNEGDSVIITPPVYFPFFHAIKNNNRKLVESELIINEETKKYEIDFKDFEEKIVNNKVKMFILCNPHNPVGRVWSRTELEKIFEICFKHNVFVISDEIHQDFIFNNNKFTSSLTLHKKYHDNLIVTNGPSKSFNLAGFSLSHAIIPNEKIREKYSNYLNRYGNVGASLIGYTATEAAYSADQDWFNTLKEIIYDNFTYLRDRLNKELPGIFVTELEGTYLAWIDFKNHKKDFELEDFLTKDCKVIANSGGMFSEKSKTFARFNLATHPKNVELALDRIIESIKK